MDEDLNRTATIPGRKEIKHFVGVCAVCDVCLMSKALACRPAVHEISTDSLKRVVHPRPFVEVAIEVVLRVVQEHSLGPGFGRRSLVRCFLGAVSQTSGRAPGRAFATAPLPP